LALLEDVIATVQCSIPIVLQCSNCTWTNVRQTVQLCIYCYDLKLYSPKTKMA